MILTLTYVRFDLWIPLLLALDGTAAPVESHALEVQPDRNQDDVDVADERSVDDEDGLELNSHNIDEWAEQKYSNDVYYLAKGYLGAEIYFGDLENLILNRNILHRYDEHIRSYCY